MHPSHFTLSSAVALWGPFFQPGWLATPSFSEVGLVSAPWSSTSTPGKVPSVWDKLVHKAPGVFCTVARLLSALRTTLPASVCLAVPALVSATSPFIPVLAGVYSIGTSCFYSSCSSSWWRLAWAVEEGWTPWQDCCLTVGELRSRSRLSLQSIAWGAISEGTKRLYKLDLYPLFYPHVLQYVSSGV